MLGFGASLLWGTVRLGWFGNITWNLKFGPIVKVQFALIFWRSDPVGLVGNNYSYFFNVGIPPGSSFILFQFSNYFFTIFHYKVNKISRFCHFGLGPS